MELAAQVMFQVEAVLKIDFEEASVQIETVVEAVQALVVDDLEEADDQEID